MGVRLWQRVEVPFALRPVDPSGLPGAQKETLQNAAAPRSRRHAKPPPTARHGRRVQSADPAKDFRGMGILGLANLVYFGEHCTTARRRTVHGVSRLVFIVRLVCLVVRLVRFARAQMSQHNQNNLSGDYFQIFDNHTTRTTTTTATTIIFAILKMRMIDFQTHIMHLEILKIGQCG